MVHKVNTSFLISSHGVWRPGVYDSEETAKYAFKFPDEVLSKIQYSKTGDDKITLEDLKTHKNETKKG